MQLSSDLGIVQAGWEEPLLACTLLSPSPILPPKARSYWFAMEALFALFFGVETLLRIHQLGLDYFLDAVLH